MNVAAYGLRSFYNSTDSTAVLTSVFVGEGSMSEVLVEEVLGGTEVAHGRSSRLPVGTEAVDELVGQLSQLGCVVDGRGARVGCDTTLQDGDHSMETGARGAKNTWWV